MADGAFATRLADPSQTSLESTHVQEWGGRRGRLVIGIHPRKAASPSPAPLSLSVSGARAVQRADSSDTDFS